MIEVVNLSRYYGHFCAVENVSFNIEDGEVVGFLGRNGAGKSTTLRVLAGLLTPSSGTVRIDGVDMTEAPTSFRKQLGFLPEDPPLYEDMTVGDFLRYVGSLRGMTAAAVEARLPEVLATAQLEDRVDQLISQLSHGYRKRVGIAQAIFHKPRLVILDEPTSGLDPAQLRGMRQVIRALSAESTVLISSHNLPEISHTCDRVLVLKKGRLVEEHADIPDELNTTTGSLSGGGPARNHVSLTLTGAVEAIRGQLASSALVKGSTVKAVDGRVLAYVLLNDDVPEALVAELVGAGIGVRRVEDGLATQLEDAFLDLTAEGA